MMKKDSPKKKKTIFKKLRWLAIPIVLLILAFILILHRPGHYNPVKVADHNQVSPYLTHQLMPAIYNGAQRGEPFEVVVTQQGLNDAIARSPQPIRLHNITLSDAQVIFTPGQIILMATARAHPVDFVITTELNPTIDRYGLLNIHVNSIALGAINITTVAKWIAASAYSNWLSSTGIDPNNIAAEVCRSLLNDEPFEPIFEISGKHVRVDKIQLAKETVKLRLIPVSDQPSRP